MSVKLICDDQTITTENFNDDVCVSKSGRKWILVNTHGTELELKFQVKNCCVKYTPEKYDKITIELDQSSRKFFEMLQLKIKDNVNIENIVKNNTLGLKMSKDQKLLCMRNLTRGDYFDAVVNFNDVWTVNGKNYVSLELIQFKKLETKPKIETINYFVDEDE